MGAETAIVVDYVLPDRRCGEGTLRAPMPSYTLALLLAQTPVTLQGCPVVARVHDEQARGPYRPAEAQPDILCLTYLTTGAPRAYRLSDEALAAHSHAGAPIKLVHGGVHATSLPNEALLHCHIVVRGEITPAFQERILADALAMAPSDRRMMRLAEPPKTLSRPPADWSWMRRKDYILAPVTQTSVGCPFGCDFCSVTEVFGAAMRTVDEEGLRKELETLPRKSLLGIIDDNFLQGTASRHIDHCLRVAALMREYGFRWVTEVTVRTLVEASRKVEEERPGFDLIRYFAERGCRGFFFGIESLDGDEAGLKKTRGLRETVELIRRCQANGIGVLGAFVLGVGPRETPDYAKRVLDFAVEEAQLDFAQFSINTPMPGARNFLTGLRNGRIFNFDWELYDAEHCVMRHPIMSPQQLESAHRWLYEQFYGYRSLLKRVEMLPLLTMSRNLWKRAVIDLPANVALHRANRSWNDRLNRALPRQVVARPHEVVMEHVARVLGEQPGRPDDLFNIRRPDGVSICV